MKFRYLTVVAFAVIAFVLGTSGVASAQHQQDSYGAFTYAPSMDRAIAASTSDYVAVAYSPSMARSFAVSASILSNAKIYALNACLRAARPNIFYQNDCRGAVWVRYGYAAVAAHVDYASNGKPTVSAWGSGWGHTYARADAEAVRVCRSHDHTGNPGRCIVRTTYSTPYVVNFTYKTSTGGQW